MNPPLEPTSPVSARGMQEKRALLVFNPEAGDTDASALQLSEMITLMQLWHITPEVHIITSETQISDVVGRALRRGVRLVVAAGGDGTIESIAQVMMGSRATLGIIPKGTRNNLALSLGIPLNMAEAVELLRHGQPVHIDVGRAACGAESLWFLETSSIGLLPALYPAADDIQHGNLTRITDLLSTLVTYQPASMRLTLDHNQLVDTQGYLALVANAPYFGVNIQVSSWVSFQDAWLDVFVFSNLTKLELIGYAAAQITTGGAEDPRILHYRVKHVAIETDPPMQVTADGTPLGEGPLLAEIYPQGLRVIAGRTATQGREEMA